MDSESHIGEQLSPRELSAKGVGDLKAKLEKFRSENADPEVIDSTERRLEIAKMKNLVEEAKFVGEPQEKISLLEKNLKIAELKLKVILLKRGLRVIDFSASLAAPEVDDELREIEERIKEAEAELSLLETSN